MKYFLILSATLALLGCRQNIIPKTEYYLDKDGKQLSKKCEYSVYMEMDSGEQFEVIQGPLKEYYKNGEIKKELNYKDGKLNGTARGYYKNGNAAEISFFIEDENEGNAKYFYENGVLKEDLSFSKGMKDGECRTYYANKQLKDIIIYKNDRVWHVIVNYDSTGRKLDELTVKDGNGVYNTYYPTGVLHSKRVLRDGVENGELIIYNPNKTVFSIVNLVNGLKDGEYKIFHGNEKLAVHAFFKEDFLIGPLKKYNEHGILIQEINYKKRLTAGDVASFNGTGIFALIANHDKTGLSKGVMDGAYKLYFDNGNLSVEEYNFDGMQDSISRKFYENGKIKYEALFDRRYQENKRYENEWDENGQLMKSYNSQNMKLVDDDGNRDEEIENLNKAIDSYNDSRN